MGWQLAVERTVSGLGYELVETERTPKGLLRVYIDKVAGAVDQTAAGATAFITVDDCERVTRQLQHVLDVEGFLYERLEVSSPGLDRPLRKPSDLARFAGSMVEVTLKAPYRGRKRYQGALEAGAAGGWRISFQANGALNALDFSLDEARDVRLVPVLDFKGRRFAASATEAAGDAVPIEEQVDGDRKQ
jgi:ribosome maturation factor RimP